MKPDIRHWQDIDAAYLTSVLALNGMDVEIANVEKAPVGTGQIGDCVRFKLDYRSAPADAPKSIIGKFPSEGEQSRQAGIAYGIYDREVKFYQTLQPKAKISTPDCYFTDIDEKTQDFVLLMSDAAPAVQGDQLEGITLDETKLIITEAAKLHAAFWLDETLNDYYWITNTKNSVVNSDPDSVPERWAEFQERYAGQVSERAKYIGDSMAANTNNYSKMRAEQQTLIHVDFRPDNMLFATSEGGKPLTIVDWQSISFGPAAVDIGNCIAGALAPEIRRKHETELLDLYVEELEKNGGGPYDPDTMKRHYLLGAYQHYLTAMASSTFVTPTPRGDKMFLKMLNGAVDLIFDHGAEDLLA